MLNEIAAMNDLYDVRHASTEHLPAPQPLNLSQENLGSHPQLLAMSDEVQQVLD